MAASVESRMRTSFRAVLLVALVAAAPAPASEPPVGEPLNLAALLAEAEVSNPELRAAAARRLAAERVPSQMQALPDPTVSLSYDNDGVDRLTLGERDMTRLSVAWTQEVPYPGKRRLAGDVARAEVGVAGQALEAARLRVRAAVKTAYADLYLLDRTRTILGESRKLLVSFRDAAKARYETGEGILENVLKAETELSKIDAELAVNAQERRSAAVALNALLGREADSPLGPAVALPPARLADREALERAALELSPEVLELEAMAQREERRLELARRNLKPDFMWTAAYANRGGLDPMVMGMVGVRLPLYRKRKQAQAVAETELGLEAARHDLERRRVDTLSEVRDLVARAERAETLERLYDSAILPQARSALDAAAASYQTAQVEFITLLEDFRTVLDYEVQYETQRAERVKALAGLEALTGTTLVLAGGEAKEGGAGDE